MPIQGKLGNLLKTKILFEITGYFESLNSVNLQEGRGCQEESGGGAKVSRLQEMGAGFYPNAEEITRVEAEAEKECRKLGDNLKVTANLS